MMFREIKIEDGGLIGIPCYGSDNYRWIIWGDDDCAEDVLKRHSSGGHKQAFTEMEVWPEGERAGEYSETKVSVYEMFCCKTGDIYLLLVYGQLYDGDCIYHSVALPYNQFCLVEFFNKYMINLAAKPYIFGD